VLDVPVVVVVVELLLVEALLVELFVVVLAVELVLSDQAVQPVEVEVELYVE